MNDLNKNQSEQAQVSCLSKAVELAIDPVVLFQNLSLDIQSKRQLSNRVLLESCAIEDKQELKSLLMNRAALRIECNQQAVKIESLSANGDNALSHLATVFDCSIITDPKSEAKNQSLVLNLDYRLDTDEKVDSCLMDEMSRLKSLTPIDCLRKINAAFTCPANHPYAVFLCGLFSFDLIASFEQLPQVAMGDNQCPDYVYYLAEELLVIDHETQQCQIYTNIFAGDNFENHYYEQSRRLSLIAEKMIQEVPLANSKKVRASFNLSEAMTQVSVNLSDQAYAQQLLKLKQNICEGDIFQVVPSRCFSIECKDKLLAYQKLKAANPSPYLFYMEDQDFTLFGASPESALKYHAKTRKVEVYPIAGTRKRGKRQDGSIDFDLDARLEIELKLDQKEVAEHTMLVDLARNDISRISQQGSIKIPRLMQVDRYSHVMHLVSCVEGKLLAELDCLHAYQACMNMGTLTGAPKIKATELIRQTEGQRRGSYGGAVGYINGFGDMDSCIVIRSAYCREGKAYIQAGAGLVHDSDPMAEAEETRKKAGAVIEAVLEANAILMNMTSSSNGAKSGDQS